MAIYKFKIWPPKNCYRSKKKIVDAEFFITFYYWKDLYVYSFNVNETLSEYQWKL